MSQRDSYARQCPKDVSILVGALLLQLAPLAPISFWCPWKNHSKLWMSGHLAICRTEEMQIFMRHDSLIKDLILQILPVKIPISVMLGIFYQLVCPYFRYSKRYQYRDHGFYGELQALAQTVVVKVCILPFSRSSIHIWEYIKFRKKSLMRQQHQVKKGLALLQRIKRLSQNQMTNLVTGDRDFVT